MSDDSQASVYLSRLTALAAKCEALEAQAEALRDENGRLRGEKRAPVQGYSAGIPWSMHLRAYDAYCKKYGSQPALIDLEGRNCRGGFGVEELDEFIPDWREELSEVTELRNRAEKAEAERDALREAGQFALEHVFDPPKGWYPDKVFAYEGTPIEEQLERRDVGAVYVSQARERLRKALAGIVERKRSDVDG